MKSLALLTVFSALLVAAPQSDLFTKAPPEVDEALRARIMIFYQAHITGKYSDAFQVVADDSRDTFLGSGRDQYKSCEITKISYTDNFTKANVVTACKGEFHWRTERMPATMAVPSTWKLVNGQWYWYVAKQDTLETPFGISRVSPDGGATTQRPAIPADPMAAARDILQKVRVDKAEVQLKGYETSSDELHLINSMPGPIRINVTFPASKGVTVKPEKAELQSGEKASIVFSYDLEEAAALCRDCLKLVKPTIMANIRVEPTGQVFPVKITFAIPPELEKQIPAQLQTPKP
jgi:hypothetical protein